MVNARRSATTACTALWLTALFVVLVFGLVLPGAMIRRHLTRFPCIMWISLVIDQPVRSIFLHFPFIFWSL